MMLMRALPRIVAAGVVIAGVILGRTAGSRRARWVAAGLAAYGAIAGVHALLTGITLGAALGGQGLFQPLLYVLQGACIGGLVILPLGWVASVVRAGIPSLRAGSPRRRVYQAVALTTCVGLVLTSVPHETARAAPSDSAATEAQSPSASGALDSSLRAIEDGDRELPRARWDVDSVVNGLERAHQRIFEWVRDNTDWIPYRGVLRGPQGVLMDRLGNSLDRALLLATMLERAGHSVRLAHGELGHDEALQMLPSVSMPRRSRAVASPTQAETTETELREIAARYQLDETALLEAHSAEAETVRRLVSDAGTRVSDQTRSLRAALAKLPKLGNSQEQLDPVAALRDHWWVQRQEGEVWVDLDVMTPQAKSGNALTAARETVGLKDAAALLHHEIAVRVIVEQWADGALKERRALDHVLRPADLIGEPIVVQFWPAAWGAEFPTTGASPRQTLQAAVLEQHEWSAALLVGREVVAQGLLRESGNVEGRPLGGPFAQLGQRMSNTLGPAQSRASGMLTAVWLEYEIRTPAAPSHTVRREVFDLLSPSARAGKVVAPAVLDDARRLTRGLALMMRTEILPLVCRPAPEFVTHLIAQSLLTNRDLLRSVGRGEFSGESTKPEAVAGRSSAMPSPLYALALARFEWSRFGDWMHVDRPGLLTRHVYPAAVGNLIAVRDATDIVANEVGVHLAATDPFAVRLEQGVLDTHAEALVRAGVHVFANTGEAFAVSQDWVTLASQEDPALAELHLSDDVRQRITQDLAAGYVVVTPRSPVPMEPEPFAGWWRIDPATGHTLGVASNGWGVSGTERGLLTNLALRFMSGFLFEYGLCLAMAEVVSQVVGEPLFMGARAAAGGCLVAAIAAGAFATLPLLWLTLRGRLVGAAFLSIRGALRRAPILGNKLEYFFGRATGSVHNVERSVAMLKQLERIGLPDTPASRQYLQEHLADVLDNPANVARVQENGRVVRESLLMGPRGGLKFETIWEGDKLITGNFFGGP